MDTCALYDVKAMMKEIDNIYISFYIVYFLILVEHVLR